MNYCIKKAKMPDLPEIARLYDELNDYLAAGMNYPGWRKGIYPTKADALSALEEDTLFIAEREGRTAGSVILNHHPEQAYHGAKWLAEYNDAQIIVVHTLAVHPDYMGQGVGKLLMDFTLQYGRKNGMKSIRLDVYEHNTPAIKLYETCGYAFIGSVDLGLSRYGLDRFRLYERLV